MPDWTTAIEGAPSIYFTLGTVSTTNRATCSHGCWPGSASSRSTCS